MRACRCMAMYAQCVAGLHSFILLLYCVNDGAVVTDASLKRCFFSFFFPPLLKSTIQKAVIVPRLVTPLILEWVQRRRRCSAGDLFHLYSDLASLVWLTSWHFAARVSFRRHLSHLKSAASSAPRWCFSMAAPAFHNSSERSINGGRKSAPAWLQKKRDAVCFIDKAARKITCNSLRCRFMSPFQRWKVPVFAQGCKQRAK